MPSHAIIAEKVAKELSYNAKPVRLVAVNGLIILRERFLKQLAPKPVELAETLANVTLEIEVSKLSLTEVRFAGVRAEVADM
jgi:hypothetical protein